MREAGWRCHLGASAAGWSGQGCASWGDGSTRGANRQEGRQAPLCCHCAQSPPALPLSSWLVDSRPGLLCLQVVAVSAAKFHSAAVSVDGRLLTWGWGRGGRLGERSVSTPPIAAATLQAAAVCGWGCLSITAWPAMQCAAAGGFQGWLQSTGTCWQVAREVEGAW